MTALLAESLQQSALSVMGAPDHLEIANLVSEAERNVLSDRARDRIGLVRDTAVWSVEHNLDTLTVPEKPFWVEWSGRPKFLPEGEGRTGFLVAANTNFENVISIITAWDDGNGARHAYAVASIDLEQVYIHAYEARRFYSRVQSESLERIMSVVSVTMPEGFSQELSILTDGDSRVNEAAMRDATAELPFILAVIQCLSSPGALSLSVESGTTLADWNPRSPGVRERIKKALRIGTSTEFRRRVNKSEGTASVSLP